MEYAIPLKNLVRVLKDLGDYEVRGLQAGFRNQKETLRIRSCEICNHFGKLNYIFK